MLFVKALTVFPEFAVERKCPLPLRTAVRACVDIPFALTAVELHCIEKSLQRS